MAHSSILTIGKSHRTLILFILFILLPVVGFIAGVSYEKHMLNKYASLLPQGVNLQDVVKGKLDEYAVKKNCPYYGVLDKSMYLPYYTVKKGDSLLSIASKQLGNSDRVTVLVALNHDRYPKLTASSPFVEVGWRLYLPPSYIPNLSSDVHAFAGEYGKKHPGGSVDIHTSVGGGSTINPDGVILHHDKTISEGDCVVVIVSRGSDFRDRAMFLQKWLPSL